LAEEVELLAGAAAEELLAGAAAEELLAGAAAEDVDEPPPQAVRSRAPATRDAASRPGGD
jgi:hypothetical protein